MINLEKTKLRFGSVPQESTPCSTKMIVSECDECNQDMVHTFLYYNRKIRRDGIDLCRSCSNRHRRYARALLNIKKHILKNFGFDLP